MVRVLIIADIRLYREGLGRVMQAEAGLDVVGAVRNPEDALVALAETDVDIVLLDIGTPGGAAAVRELADARQDLRIVALSVPDTVEDVLACAEAGIAGYVSRDGSLRDLVEAIHRVARGEMVCSPRVTAGLIRHVGVLAARGAPKPEPNAQLTAREAEIVGLLDLGLSNKQIAQRLSIEVPTVKNHVHNILEKLHVSRRGEVAGRFRGRRGVRTPSA